MKYHFASCEILRRDGILTLWDVKPKYLLGSYHYLIKLSSKDMGNYFKYVHSEYCHNFILDSGAFTFFSNKEQGKEVIKNLDNYIEKYSQFIKKWNIKNYIELDIDAIVGYEKVKKIRYEIEKKVGYQSMPVFHNRFRTKDDLNDMIAEYSYIGISNFNGRKDQRVFRNIKGIIRYCYQNGVKVHGLALTGKAILTEIPFFYSVDSSSWQSGLRFGDIPFFDIRTKRIKKIGRNNPKKVKNRGDARTRLIKHSMQEWGKYANYLEKQNGKRWW